MKEIVEAYRRWKEEHPDKGYQYDEISDFFSMASRGDLQDLMEWVDKNFK